MKFAAVSVASAVLLARLGLGQLIITTLPYVDGNTLALSLSTDALGDIETYTVSTITAGAAGVGAGGALPTTTPLVTTALTTTNTRTTKTTGKATQTTATQRVVGQETTAPPMKTTTYGYDPGNGQWTSAIWTASVTADRQVATANVPEGSIVEYSQYQSVVDSVVLASAIATGGSQGTGVTSGAERAVMGCSIMVAGVVGAGAMMLRL